MKAPTLQRIEAVTLAGPTILRQSEQMAPYVWRLADGRLGMMARIVPDPNSGDDCTGRLWYGESDDGLAFTMDDAPLLVPDAGGLDAGGCEDPTVVLTPDELVVYYSGVDADGKGSLLWASGPDVRRLEKRGIAVEEGVDEENPKEAEIAYWDGRWMLSYEYAKDDASVLGLAEGDGPDGPWRKFPAQLTSREDSWDSCHLSTGPAIVGERHGLLFYNGADKNAVWGIGWMAFDLDSMDIVARSDEPLIGPPGEEGGRNIAFSASCVTVGDDLHLYFHYNDRTMHRAVLSWNEQPRTTNRVSRD